MSLLLDSPTRKTSVWERVCEKRDLEPSWGEAALVRARRLAIFLLGGDEVYAVTNRDPRTGADVIARGIVGSHGDITTVASPLHKEIYNLGTGECLSDPELHLSTFRTRIVGGFIEVEIEE
ncbi:nitrite reductase small subunit NirD [Paramicrobacterium fandaimingii]|uniref:nitrite reductase small subunit NirD n=1 Tax=Paramicrobacterium fandaimingii TaxID=2708079 RepID=UPI001422090B|nr:nitrite reductase small subunit NirD [Microbacterium fandaimingii]